MNSEGNRRYPSTQKPQNREEQPQRQHQPLQEDTYVDQAEKVILELREEKNPKKIVTTSKIRNLLAMNTDIYNDVVRDEKEEELSQDVRSRINYLKVRFAYEAGREESVKTFVEQADILKHLDDIQGKRKQYLLFSRYMEALVAFRKYHIDKDE